MLLKDIHEREMLWIPQKIMVIFINTLVGNKTTAIELKNI
jgi:hypothetical protein